MNSRQTYELADCAEYRQTLLAQPPRLVRATVVLLVALIVASVAWAGWTEADLVVRAHGRLRPMIRSEQLPETAAEESNVSPLRAGHVVEVHVHEGDQVRQGDLLVHLDTERLDHEIDQQQQTIRFGEEELQRMDQTEAVLRQRFQVAQAKAAAELSQAEAELARARQRRSSEIRLAEVTLQTAEDKTRRFQDLARKQAVAESEVVLAEARVRKAVIELQQAKLPVDEERLVVLRQALQLVDSEHAVECAELDARRQAKNSELEAARLELASLESERRQSELRAPSDGTVTSVEVTVGDVVDAGQLVVSMAEQRGFRIDVAVTSEHVGQLRAGLPVRVKLDAWDYRKYGSVTGRRHCDCRTRLRASTGRKIGRAGSD